MSYIGREAVLDRLAKVNMDTYYGFTAAVQFGVDHAIQCIKEAPAADVAEVRHGRWVDKNKNPVPWDECNSKCPSHSAYCSECGEWLTASDEYPGTGLYCPNCGALMDKEGEHGD